MDKFVVREKEVVDGIPYLTRMDKKARHPRMVFCPLRSADVFHTRQDAEEMMSEAQRYYSDPFTIITFEQAEIEYMTWKIRRGE